MIDLLRSEWVKFRSVRSTVVTLLLAGGLVVLVAVLVSIQVNDDTTKTCEPVAAGVTTTTTPPEDPFGNYCGEGFEQVEELSVNNLTSITAGVSLAALLFGVLGVQVIGQEYRFNTIRPTFTAAPKRLKVLVAKLIVVSAACAAISLVMVSICAAIGTVMIERFEIDSVDQRLFWSIPLFAALWAMAGVGVGAIVRQPIAAILILLGESVIVESIIGSIFDWAWPWMPFSNGFQMTMRIEGNEADLRPMLEGGIYFAIVCAALFAIGAVLADHRDA